MLAPIIMSGSGPTQSGHLLVVNVGSSFYTQPGVICPFDSKAGGEYGGLLGDSPVLTSQSTDTTKDFHIFNV